MLVNVLNICSDDELMSDTDDALEEGNLSYSMLSALISNMIRIQTNRVKFVLRFPFYITFNAFVFTFNI